MNPLRSALSFLRPYWKQVTFALILLALSVITELSVPFLIQRIIDEGISKNNMDIVIHTMFFILTLALVDVLLSIGNTLLSVRVSQNFAADLRSALYRKTQDLSFTNLDNFQTGQILVRLTNDVNQVQLIVLFTMRIITRAPIMMVGSLIMLIVTSTRLASIVFILLILIAIILVFVIRNARNIFLKVQSKLDKLNQVLQENLAGIRVVKAFVRSKYENKRFDNTNVDLMNQAIKVGRLISILIPTLIFILNLGTLVVIWFGGELAINNTLTVGQILAFINYLAITLFTVLMMAMIAGQVSAASASAGRIYEIFNTEIDIKNNPEAKTLPSVNGEIKFDNVCFSYGIDCFEPVLNNVSFTAKPGEKIAILGATGSGKSSLIQLIPRFYEVTEGKITLDGIDIREIDLDFLRSQIGIALQETILFAGSIIDNIKFGKSKATMDEVMEAAKVAQAHDFITSFPDGYESIVGQRGVNLSGGQKQRIAIARALLIKPRILILDDSTSSVDAETEAKLEDALDHFGDQTTFVVAQRISTVLNADKIIVLDKGRIVDLGKHEELIVTSKIYREIYSSQLGDGGTL